MPAALRCTWQRGGTVSAGSGLGPVFRLRALEVGEHGILQGLARAEDRLDVAFLGAVEAAAKKEKFGKPVDMIERRTKIMRQCMKIGRERVASVRLLAEPAIVVVWLSLRRSADSLSWHQPVLNQDLPRCFAFRAVRLAMAALAQRKKGGSPLGTALHPFDPGRPGQAGRAAVFFRRRENAAIAPAPNSSTIDGSGTWVPELDPRELEPCELEP